MTKKPELDYLTWEDLEQVPLEPVQWFVSGFITAGVVNGLISDTATDLLMFQLGIALSSNGGRWLGLDVVKTYKDEPVRVLWFPVEDAKDELRRHLRNIDASYTKYEQPRKYALKIAQQRDKVIAVYDRADGLVKPTALYSQICAQFETFKPDIIIVGNRTDIFAVDEDNDAQARQCVALLNDLCAAHGVTIIMPMSSTGSAQWTNACRTCCRFSKVEDEDDPYQYRLALVKSNWNKVGNTIDFRWKDGVFAEEQVSMPVRRRSLETTVSSDDTETEMMAKQEFEMMVEQEFLDLLSKETYKKNPLSPKLTARNFAPSVFSKDRDCKYKGKSGMRQLHAAMDRLYAKGRIQSAEHYGHVVPHIEEVPLQ